MSTEKMREEFELELHRASERFAPDLRRYGEIGDYMQSATYWAWWAWQASRAAIEVDLPRQHGVHYPRMFSDEVRASIESLGLKVKP